MTTYSHSRLSTFEQCKLKYKYQYIDKIKTEVEETVEAFLGSRVHDALEKLYKDLKFQLLLSKEALLEFYNSEWEKNWNDAIVIVRQEYEQDNFRRMGEKFLSEYYDRYHPFNDTKTIGLETQDKIALDEKYKIHVRIDRLSIADGNIYEVHDYKTANNLPTQEYADNDRQLAIYAYGIKKMYPDAKKIRLIWHYLAFDKEVVSSRTDDQLESLRKETLDLIKTVEATTEFSSNESALCNWCNFKQICPMFKHEFSLENKDVNEYLNDEGVSLVNRYVALTEVIKNREQQLEKVKAALLAYSKKENVGVIHGSDVQATIKQYPRLSFPKKG